jgi:hypothetical protein
MLHINIFLKLLNVTLLYIIRSISLFQRRQKTEKERAKSAGKKKTCRKVQPRKVAAYLKQ